MAGFGMPAGKTSGKVLPFVKKAAGKKAAAKKAAARPGPFVKKPVAGAATPAAKANPFAKK